MTRPEDPAEGLPPPLGHMSVQGGALEEGFESGDHFKINIKINLSIYYI